MFVLSQEEMNGGGERLKEGLHSSNPSSLHDCNDGDMVQAKIGPNEASVGKGEEEGEDLEVEVDGSLFKTLLQM